MTSDCLHTRLDSETRCSTRYWPTHQIWDLFKLPSTVFTSFLLVICSQLTPNDLLPPRKSDRIVAVLDAVYLHEHEITSLHEALCCSQGRRPKHAYIITYRIACIRATNNAIMVEMFWSSSQLGLHSSNINSLDTWDNTRAVLVLQSCVETLLANTLKWSLMLELDMKFGITYEK